MSNACLRVGFIGTGMIAEPMVKSLLRRFPESSITVSPRSKSISSRLSKQFEQVEIAKSNQHVVDQSDYLVLSMLATVAKEALPILNFRADQHIVSVMVGYAVETLMVDCFPAQDISMTVPLPFIETGSCPLPVYPRDETVRRLFGDDNEIISLKSESAMMPYLATTGVVATMMHEFNEIAEWLGQQSGNEAAAEIFVLKLLSGYLHALPSDGDQQFVKALHNLSTKGGLNAQLLEHSIKSGHFKSIRTGLGQLLRRLKKAD